MPLSARPPPAPGGTERPSMGDREEAEGQGVRPKAKWTDVGRPASRARRFHFINYHLDVHSIPANPTRKQCQECSWVERGGAGGSPAAAPAAPEGLMAVPDSRRYLSAFFAYLRGPGCYISRNGIFIVPFLFLSGILKDPSK